MAITITTLLLLAAAGSSLADNCRQAREYCQNNAQLQCCSGHVCKFPAGDSWGTCEEAGASETQKSAAETPAAKKPAPSQPKPASKPAAASPTPAGALVTEQEFKNAVTSCGFGAPTHEQYAAFVARAGPSGNIKTKRELAMMLANVIQETGGLKEIKEQDHGQYHNYDGGASKEDWPGKNAPGKLYYGRGYLQLSYPKNYLVASRDLYKNEKIWENPDQVEKNQTIAWDTAFWYWKTNVHGKPGIAEGKFGVSIDGINGGVECKLHPDKTWFDPVEGEKKARQRFAYYKKVLPAFNIKEQPIENGCYN